MSITSLRLPGLTVIILTAVQTSAQIKKTAPIVIPLTEDVYITQKSFNELKSYIIGLFAMAFVFAAKGTGTYLWNWFFGKVDKLDVLLKKVEEIEGHLKHVPTKTEVDKLIKEEVDRWMQ